MSRKKRGSVTQRGDMTGSQKIQCDFKPYFDTSAKKQANNSEGSEIDIAALLGKIFPENRKAVGIARQVGTEWRFGPYYRNFESDGFVGILEQLKREKAIAFSIQRAEDQVAQQYIVLEIIQEQRVKTWCQAEEKAKNERDRFEESVMQQIDGWSKRSHLGNQAP